MRLLINLFLAILSIGLVYLIVMSIYSPIEFQNEKMKRQDAVVEKLKDIRTAQIAFRGITGKFAHDFDTLKQVLTTDSFKIVKVFGNPDAQDKKDEVRYETFYVPAKDSIQQLGLDLDDMQFVPYTDNKEKFQIQSDIIVYQSTNVPVVQVKAPWKSFMGEYAAPKYKRFDNKYNPDDITEPGYYIQFGDMNRPSTSGNWEN